MKKLIFSMLALLLIVTGCSSTGAEGTLKVYSWGEYIDPDSITAFEEEYDVRVIYDLFASNEEMYTKLASGERYDVIVPSDYMIQRLIEEDQLQPIDVSLLENFASIKSDNLGKDFDPNNEYSVPYFVGDVGIIYNTEKVDSADVERLGWEVLRFDKYKDRIFMYDSERDSFMVALKALGYSANTTDENEINEAYQWLSELDNTMSPVYAGDEIIDQLINGAKDIAVMYSGDATYMMSENESLAYYVPESQGTNVWQDAMVIMKNSENSDLAHKWMDFMLRDEIATMNTLYVGYTSPVESVYEAMVAGDYNGLESYTPSNYAKNEEFHYNKHNVEILSDLWFRVKAE